MNTCIVKNVSTELQKYRYMLLYCDVQSTDLTRQHLHIFSLDVIPVNSEIPTYPLVEEGTTLGEKTDLLI